MSETPRERLAENATEIASVLVTGFWLAALFTGQSWWLAALLIGYVVVIPLVALLFGDEDDREEWWNDWTDEDWWHGFGGLGEKEATNETSEPNNRDALETLRDRYARGELTDEQFERKLERLLETETVEDVEDRFSERERERLRERE
ncbi:SHOCT domain-containing protein [Haladaptatus salinisoli]|uniref:SHOCT domain-containing protein n=1 Tax=Haladaptatus salinisoli TaxID=2884876 RepID=UPI001D0B7E1C|nr:SHOCT domain-containing protein [Haladaptatus salinisoli]